MPRRDGTGPMGQGNLTGRGLGNCNITEVNDNLPIGRFGERAGLGQGQGRKLNLKNEQACGGRKKGNGRCCGRNQNS